MTINLAPAVKRMIDLSTSHLTEEDTDLMRLAINTSIDLPRITPHRYGWIIFVSSDFSTEQAEAMKTFGFSDAMIAIYTAAAAMGGDVMILNFDSDADQVEGLPTFNW
jgi:hypothetical protein